MSDNKILGPKQGYVEILNHFTQEKANEQAQSPRVYNPLRPSSAGKCIRELAHEWAEFKGYAKYESEVITPDTSRLLKLGSPIEKHVIWEFKDAFTQAGGDIQIRYPQQTLSFFRLADGTMVEGQCDLVILSKSQKFGGCLGDVKSKKDKFSAFYKTSWDELSGKLAEMETVEKFGEESFWVEDLPKFLKELDDYYFAMNFYQLNMYFFDDHKFLRERGVDHAAIFQYNKNDSRLREIRFKPSQEAYDYVKNKYNFIQQTVDKDKSPDNIPCEYVLGSVACAFCRFRGRCWPEDDSMKAYFKTLPAKQWPKDLDRLPVSDQSELQQLFEQYESISDVPDKLEKAEREIAGIMAKLKVYKIKLPNGNIYQTKRLKSGGVGGGERLVLRRSKL